MQTTVFQAELKEVKGCKNNCQNIGNNFFQRKAAIVAKSLFHPMIAQLYHLHFFQYRYQNLAKNPDSEQ